MSNQSGTPDLQNPKGRSADPPPDLLGPLAVTDASRRRGLMFLGLASAGIGFTMALQMGLNSNFVAGEMRLSGLQQGLLETFRESCGIVALLILAMLAGFAEPLVGAAMLVLVAVGMAGYSLVNSFLWVILASMVWSQGLHVWMPLPNSMTLALAEPGRAGHRLGQVQAAGAIGSGIALGTALVLTEYEVPIRPMYLVAGAAALLAAAACLGIPRAIQTERPRLILRRRYRLYYLMCFLEGWRKQISLAFAGYLLVKRYDTPLRTMLRLWVAIQVIGWVASPHVGRLIDRIGERAILVFYYACLTVFFVGYALVPNRHVLYGLFVLDSSFFVFGMALTIYLNRICAPSERTASLSMGVAFNHVAAVTMPLAGGLIWKYFGYRWTFIVGAFAAAMSIPAALRVPSRRPAVGVAAQAEPQP